MPLPLPTRGQQRPVRETDFKTLLCDYLTFSLLPETQVCYPWGAWCCPRWGLGPLQEQLESISGWAVLCSERPQQLCFQRPLLLLLPPPVQRGPGPLLLSWQEGRGLVWGVLLGVFWQQPALGSNLASRPLFCSRSLTQLGIAVPCLSPGQALFMSVLFFLRVMCLCCIK